VLVLLEGNTCLLGNPYGTKRHSFYGVCIVNKRVTVNRASPVLFLWWGQIHVNLGTSVWAYVNVLVIMLDTRQDEPPESWTSENLSTASELDLFVFQSVASTHGDY
jgi:hypothetical protein